MQSGHGFCLRTHAQRPMRRDYAVQPPLSRQQLRLSYAAFYAVQFGAGKQFDQAGMIVVVMMVVVPLKQIPVHTPVNKEERVTGLGFNYSWKLDRQIDRQCKQRIYTKSRLDFFFNFFFFSPANIVAQLPPGYHTALDVLCSMFYILYLCPSYILNG